MPELVSESSYGVVSEWELAGPVKSDEAKMVELLLNLCGKCARPRRYKIANKLTMSPKSQRGK